MTRKKPRLPGSPLDDDATSSVEEEVDEVAIDEVFTAARARRRQASEIHARVEAPTASNTAVAAAVADAGVQVLGVAPEVALANDYMAGAMSLGRAAGDATALHAAAATLHGASTTKAVEIVFAGGVARRANATAEALRLALATNTSSRAPDGATPRTGARESDAHVATAGAASELLFVKLGRVRADAAAALLLRRAASRRRGLESREGGEASTNPDHGSNRHSTSPGHPSALFGSSIAKPGVGPVSPFPVAPPPRPPPPAPAPDAAVCRDPPSKYARYRGFYGGRYGSTVVDAEDD